MNNPHKEFSIGWPNDEQLSVHSYSALAWKHPPGFLTVGHVSKSPRRAPLKSHVAPDTRTTKNCSPQGMRLQQRWKDSLQSQFDWDEENDGLVGWDEQISIYIVKITTTILWDSYSVSSVEKEAMIDRISGASIWLYALPFVKACSYDWGGKRNHHEKILVCYPPLHRFGSRS